MMAPKTPKEPPVIVGERVWLDGGETWRWMTASQVELLLTDHERAPMR